MATNPAAKRMSTGTGKAKRAANKIRNERIAEQSNGKVKSLTAFRHVMRQNKRIGFRPVYFSDAAQEYVAE